MLTAEIIEKNKIEYIELVDSIEREGILKDELINMLSNSDFFTSPASTKYHCAFEGGLCLHSLNVYKALKSLIETTANFTVDEDTIKIVALFHDISKIGSYKKGVKNEKVYSVNGSKRDEMGSFDWVSKPMWTTREDKFVYGSHEITSEYIIRQYVPLKLDESVAITHHMGSMAWDSAKDNIGEVYNRYPLALLLYIADMISTYILENSTHE